MTHTQRQHTTKRRDTTTHWDVCVQLYLSRAVKNNVLRFFIPTISYQNKSGVGDTMMKGQWDILGHKACSVSLAVSKIVCIPGNGDVFVLPILDGVVNVLKDNADLWDHG